MQARTWAAISSMVANQTSPLSSRDSIHAATRLMRASRPETKGCQDGDRHAAMRVGRLDLRIEHLHGLVRRLDGHGVAEIQVVHVVRPVVHAPVGRQADDLSLGGIQHVGDVVAHQARVVEKAALGEERGRVPGGVVERRPPAPGGLPRHAPDHVDLLVQPVLLTLARLVVRILVQIAVRRDLVPAFENRFDQMRIALHAPGRIEERLPDAEMRIDLQNSRDRDLVVFEERHGRQHVLGLVGEFQMQDTVGVDVESDGHGAAGAARPRHRIVDQRERHPFLLRRGGSVKRLYREPEPEPMRARRLARGPRPLDGSGGRESTT